MLAPPLPATFLILAYDDANRTQQWGSPSRTASRADDRGENGMKTSATELRSVIDEITLAVADRTESDLATKIADEATLYIDRLRQEQRMLTNDEIDRVASAIVRGVLKRLLEIAFSGGQVGRA
jgi:hypothetical protein